MTALLGLVVAVALSLIGLALPGTAAGAGGPNPSLPAANRAALPVLGPHRAPEASIPSRSSGTVSHTYDSAATRADDKGVLVVSAGSRPATRASAEMDSFTWNGSTVHHSPTATAIGDDAATMTNFGRSQGAAGHDVIVHGKVIDGQATFMTNGMPTHPQQVADAVLENPAYVRGSPVQLVTCHGACGLADDLSTALGGAPVSAVPGRVQIDPRTGLLLESKP